MKRVYLDNNATQGLRSVSQDAMHALSGHPLNPSSVHAEGRKARGIIENARQALLREVGCISGQVVFTASATESIHLALSPDLQNEASFEKKYSKLIISDVEHPAVLQGGRFGSDDVLKVSVKPNGLVDMADLADKLKAVSAKDNHSALVSIQLANSETGIIQDIAAIAWLAHQHEAILHCDATQGLGRVPISMSDLGIDMLTVSSHKIGGPHGVGALVIANDSIRPPAIFSGGGQERGFRAGTENVPAIAGFAAALEDASQNAISHQEHMKSLQSQLENGLAKANGNVKIIGSDVARLPNTTCFATPGATSQGLLIELDLAGFALSAGSACSSGKLGESHVLDAMRIPHEISGATLRLSTSHAISQTDIAQFLSVYEKIVSRYSRSDHNTAQPEMA